MSKSTPALRKRIKDAKFLPTITPHRYDDKERSHLPYSTLQYVSLLGLIIVVLLSVIVIEKKLPPGLKISEEHQYPDRFIGERAFNHLKNLTKLGPRIAGSYSNDVLAVTLLKLEIDNIVKNAKDAHTVEMDVQKVNGSFNLEFLDGLTNVYRDHINVVVKVGSRINSSHSLLLNCHFDTVVDSPGASDDGAGCAVMLEMLRVISQSNKILRHNIIFLFNGAEENFMPASHGFITKHKWAKEVRAFINLEACGAGGREILFQAGPNHPWILETYSEEVPYPFASSLAQEIFESGYIPGDTDYRIFRDFGNVSGLDFAWSANGYVYHTKFDNIEQIPLGSIQRTGDNILALAKGMAQGHQLANVEKHRAGNLVFFDFLGAFVVRWPMWVADLINVLTVIFSVGTIYGNMVEVTDAQVLTRKSYLKKLLSASGMTVVALLAAVVTSVAIALVLTLLDRTMSWYGRPVWIFFLYILPTLWTCTGVIFLHAKYSQKDVELQTWTVFQLYYDAYQIFWTVLLIGGTLLRFRSTFIALLWVSFPVVGNLLKSRLFGRWRDPWWLLMHIAIVGLPFVQSFYLILAALQLAIPLMGRAGAGTNSEVVLGAIVSILHTLMFSFAFPLILLVRGATRVFSLLWGVFLLSLAVLLLTPLGFPYSGRPGSLAPQKFMLAHVHRTYHDFSGTVTNETSGFWIVDLDMNSPHSIERHVPEFRDAILNTQDCADHLYCGLPYLVPVLNMIWKTHWIGGPKPPILVPVKMEVLGRERLQGSEQVTLRVEGPTHVGIMIAPQTGVRLVGWSFEGTVPLAGPKWKGRDTYFVYYAYGRTAMPLEFTLDFKMPAKHEGPIVDLAVTSHFLFGHGKSSKELHDLVKKFPSWTAVSSWIATYESWIL